MRNKNDKSKNWDSVSIGKEWQLKFFYIVIKLIRKPGAYFIMYFVVLWYVLFSKITYQRSMPYLRRRFKNKNRLQYFVLRYRLIAAFSKSMIDRAAFEILGPQAVRVDVPEGPELLKLLERGRGLVVIAAHTGNWQVAFSAMKFMNTPVYLLIYRDQADKHRDHREIDNNYFHIIDPAGYWGGTLEMVSALQNKSIVGIMGDRVFGNNKNFIAADFLGGRVNFPVSPYRLAAMQGTPIAVLLTHRKAGGGYETNLAGCIEVEENTGRDNEKYRKYVEQFAGILEDFTMKHPFDFFNFFDMWRENTDEGQRQ